MDRKDAILKSVLKLVNREGFYHLNMKKIALEAKVAAGTIYLYFKGKEDLINALYELALSDFNDEVAAAYTEERDVKTNFSTMLKTAINFYIDHPDHFSFIEQYTYAPFLFKENREQNFMLLRPIFKLLKKGKKEKLIKNIADEILLSIIHGGMNTMIKLHLAKKYDLKNTKNQNKFYESIWNAIALN